MKPSACRGLLALTLALQFLTHATRAQSDGMRRGEVEPLVKALADSDASVRENAAKTLGMMGPHAGAAISALIICLSDHDPYVNGEAANALGRIGKEGVPRLITALRDGAANVRWCAAIALGKIGPDAVEAVTGLSVALGDTEANVRWSAALALGALHVRAREAIPALVRCLHDRDEDVRFGANLALDEVDPVRRFRTANWKSAVASIDSLTPVLMKELQVPGVSIAVIQDRAVVWSGEYGVADVTGKNPVTRETLFEAASLTKPVFACTVMRLVEAGKLDLDRPLTEYYQEVAFPDQPSRSLITTRMVLSHTSGFPNWRKGDEERDGPLPLLFSPGARFSYSGEGMYFLQRVVEYMTGESVAKLARESVFDPMSMKESSLIWTPGVEGHLAAGHSSDGTFLMKTRYTHANAAYTLYTTPREYAAFIAGLMSPVGAAKTLLSAESREKMFAHQVSLDVRSPIGRPGRGKGTASYWGLGWSINSTEEGDIIHHSGSNRSGFRSFCQFSPARGTGIVIMTNSVRGDDLWARLIATIGDF